MITPLEFERQTSSAACFDQRLGKTETKTKSNCASDGSATLVNGFVGVELYQLGTWQVYSVTKNPDTRLITVLRR